MHAFAVFTKAYCSNTSFMAAVNYTNPKTDELFQLLNDYSNYSN